jgi:hypothetical protein
LATLSREEIAAIESLKADDLVDEAIQHYCSIKWRRHIEMSDIKKEPDQLMVSLLAAANKKKREPELARSPDDNSRRKA